MKILAIAFAYNEINYLPLKLSWANKENVDLYIIDNMSNDGTWEYLQDNNIPSHRIDTNETFDLTKLQAEVVKTLHEIKPDWVIYHGTDLFFITDNGIRNEIEIAELDGFDSLKMKCVFMNNTGEIHEPFNPFNTFFYGNFIEDLTMISKYNENINISGDNLNNINTKFIDGLIVNYGMTKTIKEREITLLRRQKSWANGLNPVFGCHYRKAKKQDWIWDKNNCVDLRNNKYIQKLSN